MSKADFNPGDQVSWVELAKPGGRAGWQRTGTFNRYVTGFDCHAQVVEEDGTEHLIEVSSLSHLPWKFQS